MMMKKERKKLLPQVAFMHYVEEKSQNEIAEELGIYRTTISRMIKQAKEEGIVEVHIKNFDTYIYQLETYIMETYQLPYVKIVPTDPEFSEAQKDDHLAIEAAIYLKQSIQPNTVVGVSWGSTLGNAISKIETKKMTNATFVPIAGGPSRINSKYHVNTLVYELARKFGGDSIFINATVVQERKLLRDGIVDSKYFQELKKYWSKLDVAIVGIGGSLYTKNSQWRDLLSEEDYEDLRLRDAVGDCCCRFFDGSGKVLVGNLYDRTIGVELEELKKVPHIISIARSKQKSKAILAAIKKGYINALISDEETIVHMLKLNKDPYLDIINRNK